MAAHRRQVFVEKVLKRLFPNVPSGQEKGTSQTVASETPPKKATSEKGKPECGRRLTDGDSKIQPEPRVYTVSLPPEGYVPCLPEPSSCTNSENASSGEDAEADQDLHDQPKRRRIRKRKSKKNLKNPNNVHIEQAELEKQQSLLQEKLQPQHTDGPTMSKNKKRKLKKKQQLRRKKAAGSAAKSSGVSFTYQPEESGSEQEDARGAAEAVPDPQEADSSGEDEEAVTQEDLEITNRKADSVRSFLKSTQEIYFYDGASKGSDSAVCVETAEELLSCLESHNMAPSDVFILDHMRRLLLMHDTERLQYALEMLPEHCMMPPEHARVISSFFNYWITHILPEKDND